MKTFTRDISLIIGLNLIYTYYYAYLAVLFSSKRVRLVSTKISITEKGAILYLQTKCFILAIPI